MYKNHEESAPLFVHFSSYILVLTVVVLTSTFISAKHLCEVLKDIGSANQGDMPTSRCVIRY